VNKPVYIVAATRTSVAPVAGALRDFDYDALAVPPITHCLETAGIAPGDVDELVLSNALGAGGNPARVAVLAAGLPERIAGLSIDRQCVGGLDAVLMAQALINSGQAEIVLAGGSESYSLRPARQFKDSWEAAPIERNQARFTPWPDKDPDMAAAADELARRLRISFERQNEWAIGSHESARAARNRMADEIANPAGVDIAHDPFARVLNARLCDRAPRLSGTVSAANTSVAADGAAMLLVVSEGVFSTLKPSFGLRLCDGATLGGDPALPGIAPVDAIRKILDRQEIRIADVGIVELMEAYAVQAIACADGAGLDQSKINLGGGSLARGHPIGASGAVLAVRLFHELKKSGGLGLAAIAAAGGLGTAALFEAVG
jgi:acetyl-CoA C-acetyltransferase